MDEGYTIYVASGLPMGLCVIFLNIFVLKCIGLRASESDVTFTFIRHNAVADTILGLLTLYQTVYNLHKYDVLRECLLRYGMICGTTLASLLTIFGPNMDMFIKVVLPLLYDRIVSPLVVRVYLVFVLVRCCRWIYRTPAQSPEPESCPKRLQFFRGSRIRLHVCRRHGDSDCCRGTVVHCTCIYFL